jgi:hypothetical protein
MSMYVNFVKDFPGRCEEILDAYGKRAAFLGREVTLMLVVASAGFNVPHERLKKSDHPSKDRHHFTIAERQLRDVRNSRFLGSVLWDQAPGSWRYGKILDDQGTLDQWKAATRGFDEYNGSGTNTKIIKADVVLDGLRNALAHGNIFTWGKRNIEMMMFLSRIDQPSICQKCGSKIDQIDKGYRVFVVSPEDFQKFLRRWFTFIRSLELSENLIAGAAV